MVDKVKCLKLETTLDGSSTDPFPREADPSQDYVAVKGLSFENLDTFLIEKVGGAVGFTIPNWSNKPTLLGNGEIDYIEFFDGATQTTPNRRARVDMTYDGSLNPTTEVWKIYNVSDGTTVLRTLTYTHTWTGFDLTKTELSVT